MSDKTRNILNWCGLIIFCLGLYFLLIQIDKLNNYNYLNVKLSSLIIYLADTGLEKQYIDIAQIYLRGSYIQVSSILSLLAIVAGFLLILFSGRSNNSAPQKCSNCGISFSIITKHCPKCNALVSTAKNNYKLYLRLGVVILAILGSFIAAMGWLQFALPSGKPCVLIPGWWFCIKYSVLYGLIFTVILIVIPKIYSSISNN